MENYIQSSELLTLNSFLFVAARPVFCCLYKLLFELKKQHESEINFCFPDGFIHLVTLSIGAYFCAFKKAQTGIQNELRIANLLLGV